MTELLRGNRRPDYSSDNQDHANNVPPDTDIIQESHKAYTKDIEHGNQSQDDGVEQQGRPLGCRVNASDTAGSCGNTREPGMQQHVKGNGSAISDTCGNTDLTDQVKPAGIPAPGRPTTATEAELGRPEIEAAAGRERGGQFGHAPRAAYHKDGGER